MFHSHFVRAIICINPLKKKIGEHHTVTKLSHFPLSVLLIIKKCDFFKFYFILMHKQQLQR